jgi:hypothetical protein
MKRPPDFTLAFAVAMYGAKRVVADEVAGELKRSFGIEATAQQVGSWLRRLTQQQYPPVEIDDAFAGFRMYALTRFGKTEIANGTRGLRSAMGWMPVVPPGFRIVADQPTPTEGER